MTELVARSKRWGVWESDLPWMGERKKRKKEMVQRIEAEEYAHAGERQIIEPTLISKGAVRNANVGRLTRVVSRRPRDPDSNEEKESAVPKVPSYRALGVFGSDMLFHWLLGNHFMTMSSS